VLAGGRSDVVENKAHGLALHEVLAVGIPGWFARLNQMQVKALFLTPVAEPGADEFRWRL
jgi:hypothetical protein